MIVCVCYFVWYECVFFFFQAEDGIRDFCLSRGLGDVYKRQIQCLSYLEEEKLLLKVLMKTLSQIISLKIY